jgi:formylmethanofuran dehydrogenase subunit B
MTSISSTSSASASATGPEPRLVVCPFCGLLCGDLALAGNAIDTRGCPRAEAGFSRPAKPARHEISGKAVALEEAVDAAAAILRDARQPLITGLGADINGLRALVALADRTGAIFDRWKSGPQLTNLGLIQRNGVIQATLAEIANRAEIILVLGRDPTPAFPRLFERVVDNAKPLYRTGAPCLAYIGPSESRPSHAALGVDITVGAAELSEALLALAAMIEGKRVPEQKHNMLPLAALGGLAQRFKDAHYAAILWDSAAFPAAQADLTVYAILTILRSLNEKTRCIGLPLGGGNNALGVQLTTLWQAGWPMRISFAEGVPVHDPWLFDAERVLEAGEADALVWTAALTDEPPPPTTIPTIALVASDTVLPVTPAVAIRVGIPGVDHSGTAVRTDNVVSVPLRTARSSDLPSVGAVASAILARLDGEHPGGGQ